MNFQDIMSLGNMLATVAWMAIAYALFKLQADTFKIQAETFREQQKISQLENKKFLLSIRPQFIIISANHVEHPITFNNVFFYSVSILVKVQFNTATDVSFRNNTPFLIDAFRNIDIEFMQSEKEYFIVSGMVKKQHLIDVIDAQIYFSDEIGTQYVQLITGTFSHPQISPPMFK